MTLIVFKHSGMGNAAAGGFMQLGKLAFIHLEMQMHHILVSILTMLYWHCASFVSFTSFESCNSYVIDPV